MPAKVTPYDLFPQTYRIDSISIFEKPQEVLMVLAQSVMPGVVRSLRERGRRDKTGRGS
jgi:hypothetical protein